jgi:DNA modification methylase
MIVCGDSLKWVNAHEGYTTIFADPPDNIGLGYGEYSDNRKAAEYLDWMYELQRLMVEKAVVSWLSFNHKWMPQILSEGSALCSLLGLELKLIIWRFTFGQYRTKDFGNGYRPILRLSKKGWSPDTSRIRVRSRRQELGDKRAVDSGRVPDDVWDFPRVVGNATERRKWHPTQHPEALLERIVLCSGGPVLDMFGGTGTTLRVCKRLDIECDIVELDKIYCERIAEENEEKVTYVR